MIHHYFNFTISSRIQDKKESYISVEKKQAFQKFDHTFLVMKKLFLEL